MLFYSKNKYFLKYGFKWFSEELLLKDAFSLITYRQCSSIDGHPLFIKNVFISSHIDLREPLSDIFSRFKKNTRYEVRRAEKDNVTCEKLVNNQDFIVFYNKFADSKSRETIGKEELSFFGDDIVFTVAKKDNRSLVMHCYIVDDSSKRVRLLYSASDFRTEIDKDYRSLVGRANRFLHFYDIETFKIAGFEVYDFGGLFDANCQPDEKAINDFKRGFGGIDVIESDYHSIPMILLQKASSRLNSFLEIINLRK